MAIDRTAAHGNRHRAGGSDWLPVSAAARLLGRGSTGPGAMQELTLGSGLVVEGTTLSATGGGSGGGTPDPHHATHEAGGSDVVTLAQSQVTGLTTALSGKVDTTDPRLSDARTPTAHHASHETGGADAIINLSATVLTSGTLPDARLSVNVARRDAANTFAQVQTFENNPGAGLRQPVFTNPTNAADTRIWRMAVNTAGQCSLQAWNDAGTLAQATPWIASRNGDLTFAADLYEKARTTAMGHWLDVPYSAGAFTASGSMTWTVESGDVVCYRYTLVGKTIFLNLELENTTVGGTVSNELRVALPAGVTCNRRVQVSNVRFFDNGSLTDAYIHINGGGTYLSVFKSAGGNMTLSTHQTTVYAQLVFEMT